MAELSLPDFPSKASLNRKRAAYAAKAAEHRAGAHAVTTRGCAYCARAARGE